MHTEMQININLPVVSSCSAFCFCFILMFMNKLMNVRNHLKPSKDPKITTHVNILETNINRLMVQKYNSKNESNVTAKNLIGLF